MFNTELADAHVEALKGKPLDEGHYDLLFGGDSVDYCKDDGSLLIRYIANAIPSGPGKLAFPALLRAAVPSHNRGVAAGGRSYIRRDGTRSNTSSAMKVLSGSVGFFGPEPRYPYCRTTAFTLRDRIGWEEILPYVRAIDAVFQRECPERYAVQRRVIDQAHPDFVIRGTAFSTMAVNRNWQTMCHTDKGDLPDGFGVMSVIQAGEYEGGYLVFPKYRVAVDVRSTDVLLADVHEYHGNTEIIGIPGEYERISTVLYCRANIGECRSAREEKTRRPHLTHSSLSANG